MENKSPPFGSNGRKGDNHALAQAMLEVMVMRGEDAPIARIKLNALFAELCSWNGIAMKLQGAIELQCSGYTWMQRARVHAFTAKEDSIVDNGVVLAAEKAIVCIAEWIQDAIKRHVGEGFYASRAGGDPRGAVLQLGVRVLPNDLPIIIDIAQQFQEKSMGREGWPVDFPQTTEEFLNMQAKRILKIQFPFKKGLRERDAIVQAAKALVDEAEAEYEKSKKGD